MPTPDCTAMTPYVEEAGAFFSYVRKSLGFPVGIGIAFVALRLPAVQRRPVPYALAIFAPSGIREYSSMPRLISRAMVDLLLPTGPWSKRTRRSMP